LRWLTDSLADIVDKVAFMADRSSFPADIARMAEDEAHDLWGLPRPTRPSLMSYLFDKK